MGYAAKGQATQKHGNSSFIKIVDTCYVGYNNFEVHFGQVNKPYNTVYVKLGKNAYFEIGVLIIVGYI